MVAALPAVDRVDLDQIRAARGHGGVIGLLRVAVGVGVVGPVEELGLGRVSGGTDVEDHVLSDPGRVVGPGGEDRRQLRGGQRGEPARRVGGIDDGEGVRARRNGNRQQPVGAGTERLVEERLAGAAATVAGRAVLLRVDVHDGDVRRQIGRDDRARMELTGVTEQKEGAQGEEFFHRARGTYATILFIRRRGGVKRGRAAGADTGSAPRWRGSGAKRVTVRLRAVLPRGFCHGPSGWDQARSLSMVREVARKGRPCPSRSATTPARSTSIFWKCGVAMCASSAAWLSQPS